MWLLRATGGRANAALLRVIDLVNERARLPAERIPKVAILLMEREWLVLLRNRLVLEIVWAVLGESEIVDPACRGRCIKLWLPLCLQLILLEYVGDYWSALVFLAGSVSVLWGPAAIDGPSASEQDILIGITRLRHLRASYVLGIIALHCV